MASSRATGAARFDFGHAVPEGEVPGCRLYHLVPYGLGSGRCEGLVSYINRLARAHCVSPHNLLKYVFAEVDPGIAGLHRNSFYVSYVGTANGLGEYAERLSMAANLLTGHIDLARLTMLPWSDIMPVNSEGLISRYPRWCIRCFKEQLAGSGETYCPLVWSLKLYRHCLKHQCVLQDHCPHCGRQQAHLPKVPDGVLCCHCRSSLLSSPVDLLEGSGQLDREKTIESAIARNNDLVNTASHENFLCALKFLLDQTTGGNRAAFCRIMGWNEWALNGWIKEGERITFPKLVEIALRFQINPVDLCIGTPAPITSSLARPCDHPGQRLIYRAPKPQLTPPQREGIRGQLLTILQSGTAPQPLSRIATQFSVTRAGLKYWFPDLCAEISLRRQRLRAGQAVLAQEERKKIVSHAVADVMACGQAPSRRAIDATIRKFGLALARPEVFQTYCTTVRASAELISEQPYDQAGRYTALMSNRGPGIVRRKTGQSSKLRAK